MICQEPGTGPTDEPVDAILPNCIVNLSPGVGAATIEATKPASDRRWSADSTE